MAQLIPAGLTAKHFSAWLLHYTVALDHVTAQNTAVIKLLEFAAWPFFYCPILSLCDDKRLLQVLQQLSPDAKHLSYLHSNAWLKVINQRWRMLLSFIFFFHPPQKKKKIITSHWIHCPFATNNLWVGMSWYVELPVSVSKNKSRHAKYCFHSTVPYKSLLFRQ